MFGVLTSAGYAAEGVVYSVATELHMGNPGEVNTKDFYVSLGQKHGVRKGSTLKVIRKNPSYDLEAKKLFKDVSFPIATLKVIHVENEVAIARLEKMFPKEETPVMLPPAVMVGDRVEVSR